MLDVLIVGCGGFCGAASRYLVSLAAGRLPAGGFPLGTFLVNLAGAFLIGFFSQFFALRLPDRRRTLLFLTTGLMGGFTTFSTFSLETVNLWQNGRQGLAVLNVALSVGCCLAGVLLGKLLARRIFA